MSLDRIATLSKGVKVEKPRFFRLDEKERAKVQRKLSYVEKGTPEQVLWRWAFSISTNIFQINDYAHILSRECVDRFGITAFEKLNGKKS